MSITALNVDTLKTSIKIAGKKKYINCMTISLENTTKPNIYKHVIDIPNEYKFHMLIADLNDINFFINAYHNHEKVTEISFPMTKNSKNIIYTGYFFIEQMNSIINTIFNNKVAYEIDIVGKISNTKTKQIYEREKVMFT